MGGKYMAHPAFKFGDILGNDRLPESRAMVIGINNDSHLLSGVYWYAIVVSNGLDTWSCGDMFSMLDSEFWQKVEDADDDTK